MDSPSIAAFQTTFAIPLHCPACITDLTKTLNPLPGIHSITADLPTQLLHITGTTPPSIIISAIQSTGRDAILRGSGQSNSDNTAAVCILETHSPHVPAGEGTIRGLARMVQVSSSGGEDLPRMLVDLTLRGVQSGTYHVTVRQTGDISRGAESTGAVWNGNDDDRGLRGYWGEVEVRRDGKGSVFLDRKVRITEMIGRAMVASKASPEADGTRFSEHEEATVVGVIARSAGLWDNEKTVCSCSGKNVWEERKEQVGKGMM